MSAGNVVLERMLEPVLTEEFARYLVGLRADLATQARVDELADKANEGLLTREERDEYDAYITANDIIAILQAHARRALRRREVA